MLDRRLFTGDSASVGVGRARPDQLFRCTPGNSPGTQQCRFLVAGHVDPVADLLQLDPVRGIPGAVEQAEPGPRSCVRCRVAVSSRPMSSGYALSLSLERNGPRRDHE